MPTIDGLASGLDTSKIIEDLLAVQKAQVDRFTARKAVIQEKKDAFKSVQAKMVSLQLSLGSLARGASGAFARKKIAVSDETAVTASVSNSATAGTYTLRVTQLAQNHQIGSRIANSPDAAVAQGTIEIGVGANARVSVTVDDSNDTLEGLARSINAKKAGVTASVIHRTTGYQLLLTANTTGTANNITVQETANNPGDTSLLPAFNLASPVQAAQNAVVTLGSGAGAITVESADNQIDDLFTGMTVNLVKADPAKEITLTVNNDIEAAKTAIEEFVTGYNEFVDLVAEGTKYDPETDEAGQLFGNRAVRTTTLRMGQILGSNVAGVNSVANTLREVGIRLDEAGKLTVNSGTLERALNGQVDGVDIDDVRKLFGFSATFDQPNSFEFVGASAKTRITAEAPNGNPYIVQIISAARQGTVTGANNVAASTVIDATNDTLTLRLDGKTYEDISLKRGTYTASELSDMLEERINAQSSTAARLVSVDLEGQKLKITSQTYGTSSNLGEFSGNSLSALGFSGTETNTGQNVIGKFAYQNERGDTITELATGRGNILTGNDFNAKKQPQLTAGLQVRVNLTPAEITDQTGVLSMVTVTGGIAARLNSTITTFLEEDGTMDNEVQTFDGQIKNIDKSIERLTARFESAQQSLIEQFTRLESNVSSLQGLSSLLGAQLSSIPRIGS